MTSDNAPGNAERVARAMWEEMQTAEYALRDEAHELLEARQASHGDAMVIVLALTFSGRREPLYRSYIFEKLAAVSGPLPANLLDPFKVRQLIHALKDHADRPVPWIAETSGNKWW